MKNRISFVLLIIVVISALSIPIGYWIIQNNQKNEVDEINDLIVKVTKDIPAGTKLSFTSTNKNLTGIVFFDYALLNLAPIVVTDSNFENDTIIAIDKTQNYVTNSYKDYTLISKARDFNYIVQLLVKK